MGLFLAKQYISFYPLENQGAEVKPSGYELKEFPVISGSSKALTKIEKLPSERDSI